MRRNIPWTVLKTFKRRASLKSLHGKSEFIIISCQKKNEFKKISDELIFEYSNLGFLSIFKEFKGLLSSKYSMNLEEWSAYKI